MEKEKLKWNELMVSDGIPTGKNSEVRVNLAEALTEEGKLIIAVGMHKWAKYLTANDKTQGITTENVSFRPTGGSSKQTLAFPPEIIPYIVEELQGIYRYALKHKYI